MNKKAYRLIFSKSRGMLVAVAEIVVGHVKASTPARAPKVIGIDSVYTFFPVKAISLSACLMLGSVLQLVSTQTQAQNLPTGGQVVGGAASIAQPNANKMEITQTTSKAVINWNTFNVGAGNTVHFIQPSSNSQVLNRVVGINGGSSQILGTLTANGQVFIVNPQGIVFGNGSMVNVGALLASTRDISPNAFMAGGNLQFSADVNASGLISNAGSLNASSGFVVLAADQIRNTGSINAPGGQVMLTAGDRATLSLSNGQLVQFTVNQNGNNVAIASNGVIQAQDGKVVLNVNATNSLLNSVINLSGVVSAQGGAVAVDAGANGKVKLDTATVDVSHQGGPAGNITLSAQEVALTNSKLLAGGVNGKGGTIILAGNGANKSSQVSVEDSIIDVSALAVTGNSGNQGGTTILSGNRVALLGNSTIDASGANGGGSVIIGGDQLGKSGSLMPVPLANQTYIGSNANILIGSSAGDGGFVETSGQTLTMLGSVMGASKGKNGEWLIDPTDITINTVASANVTNNSNVWSGVGTNSTGNVLNTSITNALATGTNVTVTTASSGSADGNLTVAADLVVTNPGNSTLTLFANRSLTFNGVNVCATGVGTLMLNATAANGSLTVNNTNFSLNGGTGILSGNGSIRSINGVNINGNVFLNGNDQISIVGSANSSAHGVYHSGNLTQNNGVLNITGANSNGTGSGVYLIGNVTHNAGTLNITGTNFNSTGNGVDYLSGFLVQNNGSLNLLGNSTGTTTGGGVRLGNNLTQNNGSINITGMSNSTHGVTLKGNITQNNDGALNITGTTYNPNPVAANAVLMELGNITQNNGTINITGNGNQGYGILQTNLVVTQNNGSLSMTGLSNASSATALGYIIQNNGSMNITSTGNLSTGMDANYHITQYAGSMNLTGTSNGNHGVRLVNITQYGGSLNVSGTSTNFNGVIILDGNSVQNGTGSINITGISDLGPGFTAYAGSLSQVNGSLNITGISNISNGIALTGTVINQTGGTLNITGNSNYSSGITLGQTTSLGISTSYNTTTSLWTNVTKVVNATNTSTYDTNTSYSNGTSCLTTTTLPVFNLTVANGNNVNVNGISKTGTGITVEGRSNLSIAAGTLVLNGTISQAQGSGIRLSGSQTNTTSVITTGANTTTTTSNQSISTALNLLSAGNVTFVGSSASGAGIYLAGGNVTLNNSGTGSLNFYGTSTSGQGVQFGGVTRTINTNTSALNSTTGGSNTTSNSSSIIGPYLNLTVAGSGSSPSLFGTSTSSIGAYLGNVTFAGSALNISGTSNAGAGVQIGGLNSTTAMPAVLNFSSSVLTIAANYSVPQNYIITTTNTTTNVGLVADTTGNLTQNNGSLNIAGTSSSSNGVLLQGNVAQTNGSLNVSTVVGDLNQSANLSITNRLQLLAGTGSAAGNSGGGNVTIGSKINASSNATLVIFSGSPNTAAYQTNITGANSTGVYYKTYNASAANVSPISGTQNYYYREAPIQTVTVNNKVYDTTTNASAVVSSVDGDVYHASGMFFNNASAGVQAVNTNALVVTNTQSPQWNTTGYTSGGVSTSATIARSQVILDQPGTVSNKPFDGSTSATVTSNSSGSVQLGDPVLADGSLAAPIAFGPSGVLTTGAFVNPLPGQKSVNLSNTLVDAANYTMVSGSALTTNAEIYSNPSAQTVVAASSSSSFLLQGLSNSGSSAASTISKADSTTSSAPSSASSQGSSGSSAKGDQKSSTASASAKTVSVSPSPGGDVPIPAASIIALAD